MVKKFIFILLLILKKISKELVAYISGVDIWRLKKKKRRTFSYFHVRNLAPNNVELCPTILGSVSGLYLRVSK